MALDCRGRSMTGNVGELARRNRRNCAGIRPLHYSLCQGMLGLPLDRRRQPEKFGLSQRTGYHLDHLGLSLRECPCLVHHHRVDVSGGLEGQRVLE